MEARLISDSFMLRSLKLPRISGNSHDRGVDEGGGGGGSWGAREAPVVLLKDIFADEQ